MENPCKLVFFGDSIAKGYAPKFDALLRQEYTDHVIETVNAGISGETSRDGLARLEGVVGEEAHVAVIGFGMNDWRKGVGKTEFRRNISRMVDDFETVGARVILTTINPVTEGDRRRSNAQVDAYNRIVHEVALEKRVKIADVNAMWKDEFRPAQRGLRDAIHPNSKGFELICRALMHIVPRRCTTVLWQYNGHEAKCNYKCPYCYYVGLWHPTDYFFGTVEQWHDGFRRSFGKQPLVFYLAFGEPSIGANFFEILDMAADEPNWQLRMTSNVAGPVKDIVKTRLARDGRLHINASFHPLTVDRDEFLKTVLFLREHGIEVPVVYVAYPPFMDRLEDDVEAFARHGFVVHLRRFQGVFKGREFPYAYTDAERRYLARFMDDGSIKYMLNQQHNTGDLTYSGLHFFVVDNVGNVGYDSNLFPPYSKFRCFFGNVHQGNFRPLTRPGPYPGRRQATVDGVANLVGAGYRPLEGNNVIAFARQGGVYKTEDGVFYKHLDTNFEDPAIRANYNFPPRGSLGRFLVRAGRAGRRFRRALSRFSMSDDG
jgi:lysophospholipase L1-like esterase